MDEKEMSKLKAAYALNLCTVSVSQIIDYNDIHILEQEYDAILNNLNLHEMPKDEAFLKILKQLLDTIAFFKMQEGDKKFIEQDYQQKMKDAIWKAIPSPAIFIMTDGEGHLQLPSIILIATQIGTGYMNYRRAKADAKRERARELWQLQKTAMEQFEGLQRELFDTSWRISEKYSFEDKYRLTEKQIKQYNEILMDDNPIRKYERLETIQQYFEAYPPFWYQFGSASNAIYYKYKQIPERVSLANYYKQKAEECFENFHANYIPLLREDQIAASCYLEWSDLLDAKKDKLKIEKCLKTAREFAGKELDVLQIIAIGYQRIGERDKAESILRQLVNEEYNTVVNAQLLSGIYAAKVIEGDIEAHYRYELLSDRVDDPRSLFPLLESGNREEAELLFLNTQKELLGQKIDLTVDAVFEKYKTALNMIIPEPNVNKEYEEEFFSTKALSERKMNYSLEFKRRRALGEFQERLAIVDLEYDVEVIFGKIEHSLHDMGSYIDFGVHKEAFNTNKESSLSSIRSLIQNPSKFTKSDIDKLLDYMNSFISKENTEELKRELKEGLDSIEMEDISNLNSILRNWCILEKVPEPEISFDSEAPKKEIDETVVIKKVKDNLLALNGEKIAVYIKKESKDFVRYFSGKTSIKYMKYTLAVIDDKSWTDQDILFTKDGILVLRNNFPNSGIVPYSSIKKPTKNGLQIGKNCIKNKNLDLEKLYEVIKIFDVMYTAK